MNKNYNPVMISPSKLGKVLLLLKSSNLRERSSRETKVFSFA